MKVEDVAPEPRRVSKRSKSLVNTQPTEPVPKEPSPKRKRKSNRVQVTLQECVSLEASNKCTPKRRGGKKAGSSSSKTPNSGRRSSRESRRTTPKSPKPSKSFAKTAKDYSYDDIFIEDGDNAPEEDENVDAADEDSEYAPSDTELEQLVDSAEIQPKSLIRTRRSKLSSNRRGDALDDDEEEESESENGIDGVNGQVSGDHEKDIYDFDNQSILSDKRAGAMRKRVSLKTGRKSGTGVRIMRKRTSQIGTSWSSNIYSALSAALRTRDDLEAYTNFLKSSNLNSTLDVVISDVTKPSSQHANLFYGASASLQSLLSRINDHDKVVELLHAFVSSDLEILQHRVSSLIPIIHQPIFGTNHVPLFCDTFVSLATSIDPEMVIRPGYVLNQETNLLAMRAVDANECGITNVQYNTITGYGNVGRYVPEIKQLVVPPDVHEKLNGMVSLPPERMYDIALNKACQGESDTSEPVNMKRIVMVFEDKTLIAVSLLDTWEKTSVPKNRERSALNLLSIDKDVRVSSKFKPVASALDETVEDQVGEVVDSPVDWIPLESGGASASKRCDNEFAFNKLRFVDAFLVKPNSRRDALFLVANQNCCHPPLDPNAGECDNFCIYSVVDECHFILEKHGFAPDMPIALDGVHLADPEELLEDKSLLVVPNLLYDTLRKVMLRELISSSGALSVVTAVAPSKKSEQLTSTSAKPVVQCAKFVILDRDRRVPISVIFDSPVRLTLQVAIDDLRLNPFGSAASKQFDEISPAELKDAEQNFKPTSAQYRVVAINGLLFGVQIDELRVVRRILELVPARFESVFPHMGKMARCAQSVVGSYESCSSSVRIINEETSSSTVLPALYYPHFDRQKLGEVILGFADNVFDQLLELPIKVSLFDVVFRMAQKHMPELLARQHVEAADAAARAEAAANPHCPAPPPVPLPDYWGVCCMCAKELRSINGLMDHELRHVGLTRHRDRKSLQQIHTSNDRSGVGVSNLGRDHDSGSEHEDDEGDTHGVLAGLAQVFNADLLVGRMEAPQCEKCGDYLLSADILAQHLDFCDGVSFCIRTPLPRDLAYQRSTSDENGETSFPDITEDGEISSTAEPGSVCGICGLQLGSKERIMHHFKVHHLQCIACNKVLRSVDELSQHYRIHMEGSGGRAPISSTLPSHASKSDVMQDAANIKSEVENGTTGAPWMSDLLSCDICSNFWGTKYNYYFHQWAEHGVVHPPLGSSDETPQLHQNRRKSKGSVQTGGVSSINCKFCKAALRVAGKAYIEHLAEMHSVTADPNSICKICADVFESPSALSTHLNQTYVPSGEYTNAGLQTIFRCPHCEFWAFSKGLIKHSQVEHDDSNPEMYECPHCYERFSDKRQWTTHVEKHNQGYSHTCTVCSHSFRLRQSLLNHMRTAHGGDKRPATCEFCGLTYPKQSALRFHIARLHNHELEYECEMCHRRFRLETELRRHAKEVHSGAVRCEICHKVCTNLRCYAQHRQKHFRTRIYQCTDCETTFKSKLAMKRHIRVEHLQLGPEKFECQICGRVVTQIGMHMLTHKEARFECEYCGKRFTKAAYYNEHLRIHRGEQPFECHICQKRFNKKSNLNVHLRFHEKHRDEEGNYLELKPRGRTSTMFGDALLSPSDRAARQAALRSKSVPKVDVAVGSDLPGAFNFGGPAHAASEAASQFEGLMYDGNDGLSNHVDLNDVMESPAPKKLESLVDCSVTL